MQVYLVGGAVRDTLLGRPVTERDYVVVGATPDDMLAKGFTQVGKDFPVFLHPRTNEEYALARTERKSGAGYTGFICDASSEVTLEEDLRRRDLTVNAIAQDDSGNIIDPYNGKADLENRCLRHVSQAFSEDPLRVFRAARFAARYAYLDFYIAEDTIALMTSMATSGELKALSAERVWQETKRSLLEQSPEVYFSTLAKSKALPSWFMELSDVIDDAIALLVKAVAATNGNGNSNDNGDGSIDSKADENVSADKKEQDDTQILITRFTSLCMLLNEQQAASLCKRLRVPNQVSEIVVLACKFKTLLLGNSIGSATSHRASSTETCITSDALITVFNAADAWRRAERFERLLFAIGPAAEASGVKWSATHGLINKALAAANQVNVKDIIAKGHKGAAIKEALDKEKLQAIGHAIKSVKGEGAK
ncbi:CCA tRNA nucleotidyltransferase [Alteromonas sp.]|uniref:CCA tRNA nucleotidyltransferase n=1 Tax=Alteromonas sp. TaxID=232 RepID=UPI000B6E9271|nr:CCA tRNA nucleotidyltransferase [Alteromonas sp.]MAI39546.1 CCA tRNA nucleotidyltransferase [Alteromonas sp.]OUX83667.1 MAG: CCA tRNA nucleotidyltransferase [Alteromonas sp. TMED35]|tara:strand:+ start:671 stop:1939 length:1269 start_codon:yes stop_codon:yes gene_type:complete